MKTLIKISILFIIYNMTACVEPQKTYSQEVSVNFQVFYDDLSPYGTWVLSPEYGYVWVPDVAPGFAPYATNGYWVYTDFGWTWVSDYPWGWAPFHYGRWYFDPLYGPIWIPGNEWGPGWVVWRSSYDCYGWAPLGPGYELTSNYDIPYDQWTFVNNQYFGRRNSSLNYVDGSRNAELVRNSQVINNTRVDKTNNVLYVAGPERADVEKRTGEKTEPVSIKERNVPGQDLAKNQLEIYRPVVQKNTSSVEKPAPTKVADFKDLKIISPKTAVPVQTQPAQPEQKTPIRKGENEKQIPEPKQQVSPKKMEGEKQVPQPETNPIRKEERQPQPPQRMEKSQPQQQMEIQKIPPQPQQPQPQRTTPPRNRGPK